MSGNQSYAYVIIDYNTASDDDVLDDIVKELNTYGKQGYCLSEVLEYNKFNKMTGMNETHFQYFLMKMI